MSCSIGCQPPDVISDGQPTMPALKPPQILYRSSLKHSATEARNMLMWFTAAHVCKATGHVDHHTAPAPCQKSPCTNAPITWHRVPTTGVQGVAWSPQGWSAQQKALQQPCQHRRVPNQLHAEICVLHLQNSPPAFKDVMAAYLVTQEPGQHLVGSVADL